MVSNPKLTIKEYIQYRDVFVIQYEEHLKSSHNDATSEVYCYNLDKGLSEPIEFFFNNKSIKKSFNGTFRDVLVYREKIFITDSQEKTMTIFKLDSFSGQYVELTSGSVIDLKDDLADCKLIKVLDVSFYFFHNPSKTLRVWNAL